MTTPAKESGARGDTTTSLTPGLEQVTTNLKPNCIPKPCPRCGQGRHRSSCLVERYPGRPHQLSHTRTDRRATWPAPTSRDRRATWPGSTRPRATRSELTRPRATRPELSWGLGHLDVEPEPELQLGGRPTRPVLLDERSPARTAPTHNPVDTWPATSAGDWAEPSPRV